MMGKGAATPGAANDVLKKLKILMNFAVQNGGRCDDLMIRVKRAACGGSGIST
jgi:hypothetical protein